MPTVVRKIPFSNFLTSPTIRLLPDPYAVSKPDRCDTQFIVHRSLLIKLSPNLKKRTRENYIIVEGADESTVGRFVEWVYQGDYSIPDASNSEDEHETEREEEEVHPIVAAAAMGAVGVWAKKPAIFGRKYAYDGDTSVGAGIRSKYIDLKSGKAIHTLHPEGKGKNVQLATPPQSPINDKSGFFLQLLPLTPVIPEAPRLEKLYPYPVDKLPKDVLYQLKLAGHLEQHLNVYLLSLRYLIPALAHLSLSKISNVFELGRVNGETLSTFLQKIYKMDITRGRKIRMFIGKYIAGRLKELKMDKSFRNVLANGGDFVVDMVEYFGSGDSGDCWVR